MAVVLGAVVAVGGLAIAHGDYSDYGDYGDYSDYSDAEARREKRIESLEEDAGRAEGILCEYKEKSVNPQLSSQELKDEDAMEVSAKAMDKDARESINRKEKEERLRETKDLGKELRQIDELLRKIEEIERGKA